MIPLIVLVVAFTVFRLAGLGVSYFADWQHALRAALGAMFLLTASAHWGKRRSDLVRMVPAGLGDAASWVTATGVAELLIALGLQISAAARWTAWTGFLMLVALFPANVNAARKGLTIDGRPVPGIWARAAIQIVFLAALAAAAWPQ